MGGKVHVYKRENSNRWQCSTYLAGKNRRVSTKKTNLARAIDFAEEWYLELRVKAHAGEIHAEKTFSEATTQFMREWETITAGQRNADYVRATICAFGSTCCPFSVRWPCRR